MRSNVAVVLLLDVVEPNCAAFCSSAVADICGIAPPPLVPLLHPPGAVLL